MASAEENEALSAAREARLTLKEAVSAVEVAAAAPAEDPSWRELNVRELRRLREAFDDHVDEVEAEDGLLRELARDAPHLSNRIFEVEREHPVICAQIDEVIRLADGDGDPQAVRDASLAALVAIARHRQHGADLVYKAYMVDIGGGD